MHVTYEKLDVFTRTKEYNCQLHTLWPHFLLQPLPGQQLGILKLTEMPTMWLSDTQSMLTNLSNTRLTYNERHSANDGFNIEIGVAFCSGGRYGYKARQSIVIIAETTLQGASS